LLNRGQSTSLSGSQPLWLDVGIRYLIRQASVGRGWDTQTMGYIYSLQTTDGVAMVAYHWHPYGMSHVTLPHLHVSGAVNELISRRTHLPTGRVFLEDVVRLIIEEFHVPPRRPDWSEVLDMSRREAIE
jgi:hypothetical protein